MGYRQLGPRIHRDTADVDPRTELHVLGNPAHAAAAGCGDAHLLRLGTCLSDQVAVLVLVVDLVERSEPCGTVLIRLKALKVAPECLGLGVEARVPLLGLPVESDLAVENREVEARLRDRD